MSSNKSIYIYIYIYIYIIYMLYFLLKFNLPTNFYFFATDIATIERDLKIVFGFVHSTEVHKSHICVK